MSLKMIVFNRFLHKTTIIIDVILFFVRYPSFVMYVFLSCIACFSFKECLFVLYICSMIRVNPMLLIRCVDRID